MKNKELIKNEIEKRARLEINGFLDGVFGISTPAPFEKTELLDADKIKLDTLVSLARNLVKDKKFNIVELDKHVEDEIERLTALEVEEEQKKLEENENVILEEKEAEFKELLEKAKQKKEEILKKSRDADYEIKEIKKEIEEQRVRHNTYLNFKAMQDFKNSELFMLMKGYKEKPSKEILNKISNILKTDLENINSKVLELFEKHPELFTTSKHPSNLLYLPNICRRYWRVLSGAQNTYLRRKKKLLEK